MRTASRHSIVLGLTAFLAACGGSGTDAPPAQARGGSAGPIPEGAEMPADHPPISQLPADHPDVTDSVQAAPLDRAPLGDARTGTVLEIQQTGNYTYALMDIEGDEIWVAGPRAPLEEGDEITISGIMGMTDFYARSLDRTFDQILFASIYTRGG